MFSEQNDSMMLRSVKLMMRMIAKERKIMIWEVITKRSSLAIASAVIVDVNIFDVLSEEGKASKVDMCANYLCN